MLFRLAPPSYLRDRLILKQVVRTPPPVRS